MSDKFAFLASPRFWQLFLVGLTAGLNVPLPDNPWIKGLSVAIGIWLGGSVAVRTVDRMSEPKEDKASQPPVG